MATGKARVLPLMFAASYPERTRAVVVNDVAATERRSFEHPWGMTAEEIDAEVRVVRERWGTRRWFEEWLTHTADPPGVDREELFEWNVRRLRRAASPSAAAAFWRASHDTDVRDVLAAVRAPTTIIRTVREPGPVRYVAERIPNARYVEIPTDGCTLWLAHPPWRHAILGELRARLEGEVDVADDRVLTTVLFTDIVASTRRAAELGDRAWADLVQRHHALVRQQLARFRGLEVDTAGDGFFATFDGPARAVRCACAIAERVETIGLSIRAGIHTGECEIAHGKITGIAVNIVARVSALADPGEVFVTSTVKDLVAGSGFRFDDRGERELKGVPSPLRLYRALGEDEREPE